MFQSSKVEMPLRTVKVTTENKPRSRYYSKSIEYLLRDRRKLVGLVIVILLPVTTNIWRLIPEDITFPYWETLNSFAYHFFLTSVCLIVSLAWYFNTHRKDYVQQIIVGSVIYYGIFMVFTVLPIAEETPLWQELIAVLVIFFFVHLCIRHIRNYYLERPTDYKMLHDGLVHDLHHQRFMGSINRIEGLVHVAKMEEPYKDLCEKELDDLKRSVAYIANKYNDLA